MNIIIIITAGGGYHCDDDYTHRICILDIETTQLLSLYIYSKSLVVHRAKVRARTYMRLSLIGELIIE